MKLYNSRGPNPHIVRMFMAEKGIQIPRHEIDVRGGENRLEPYITKVNSRGQCPALELDDGTIITEITAICEYLEEKHPAPALIGSNAEQRALTRMWTRRVDIAICEPMTNGYRAAEAHERFKTRFRVLPESADNLKAIGQDNLAWLDQDLAGRAYLCGERFSLADILLYGFLSFLAGNGQPLNPALENVSSWFDRVAARPTATA